MEVIVNGESRSLKQSCTLDEALRDLGYRGRFFAVAIDGVFVPRHNYPTHQVTPGDHLDILSPMQGG